jgi:hypothetical protein
MNESAGQCAEIQQLQIDCHRRIYCNFIEQRSNMEPLPNLSLVYRCLRTAGFSTVMLNALSFSLYGQRSARFSIFFFFLSLQKIVRLFVNSLAPTQKAVCGRDERLLDFNTVRKSSTLPAQHLKGFFETSWKAGESE